MKLAQRGGIWGRKLAFAIGFLAVCCAANLLAFTPDFPAEWVGNAASSSLSVSQYVDTGVNAQSGTKAEFEIEFAVIDQDHSVLDVRYDTSNSGRFYLLHLYNRHFGLGYGKYLEIKSHTVQPDTRYRVISLLEAGRQSMVVTNVTSWMSAFFFCFLSCAKAAVPAISSRVRVMNK